MSSTRSNVRPWVTAYQNAPPSACATLRNNLNTVEWGYTCVFTEEDSDPAPFPINTACLPWATGTVPASNTFYSPATACPTSWTAVATRTAASSGADDWVGGETAIECCPNGFVGGSPGMCNPGTSGTWPVVVCGEADAEENENRVYTAGAWPASATARVTALQLRYQASDLGSASATATGSGSTSTSLSDSGSGNKEGSGLSTGSKAAIGTVIPLVFILGALAAFLLWRRRKRGKQAVALSKDYTDGYETRQSYEKVTPVPYHTSLGLKGIPTAAAVTQDGQHETPEWNAELDATEAERRRYMAVQGSLFPGASGSNVIAASPADTSEANELGGIMRVDRKPVAPVELDSTPLTMELDGSNTIRGGDGNRT
jgi:hypothetical protein